MAADLLEALRWFVVLTAELAALFLALSFLVGLLRAWVPEEKVRRVFEERGPVGSYLAAAVLGTVTPFCSFSTVPVLAGLLRSGAPFGPTMTFLFASPLLDPVVLGVLAFVVGFEGAALYAVVTFVGSLGLGALLARLGLEKDVKDAVLLRIESEEACNSRGKRSVWRLAWIEARASSLPVLPYLVVGTAVGAAVYGFVPTAWVVTVAGPGQPFAVPLAAALGVPVYVNAETFFPLAAALLEKGMGSGPVVALVVTAMGVSIPEIALLAGLFRSRLVAALVASVFAVAICSGWTFSLVVT